jgi:hypothetical protein
VQPLPPRLCRSNGSKQKLPAHTRTHDGDGGGRDASGIRNGGAAKGAPSSFHSLVSLRVTFAALRAPVDLLFTVALEALETNGTINVLVAVSLANLALLSWGAATDTEVMQSRGVVAVVLTPLK